MHGTGKLQVKNGKTVFLGGDSVITGDTLIPDPRRGTGLSPNMVSRLDDHLGGLPMVDVQAGIPDFSSTRVKVVKL